MNKFVLTLVLVLLYMCQAKAQDTARFSSGCLLPIREVFAVSDGDTIFGSIKVRYNREYTISVCGNTRNETIPFTQFQWKLPVITDRSVKTGSDQEIRFFNRDGYVPANTTIFGDSIEWVPVGPSGVYAVELFQEEESTVLFLDYTANNTAVPSNPTGTISIYPNPTSASTTISVTGVSGKVRIAVVDINGREVASETLECSTDCVKTMDVEKLAQGAYFVLITNKDSLLAAEKIVVQ